MSMPPAAFQRMTSVCPTGASLLEGMVCTRATCFGVNDCSIVKYGSGALSNHAWTNPTAVPARLMAGVVTLMSSFPRRISGEPSTGSIDNRPTVPWVSDTHTERPSRDQPVMSGCSSKVFARTRGVPPFDGMTRTHAVDGHVGGSAARTYAIEVPSGEYAGVSSLAAVAASDFGVPPET